MSVFDTLSIKRIYSNPYYPRGNSRIKNVHNFLKQTIAKFMHGSYNIAPSVDDFGSPFYLVHGRDPLKGRLSSLQNYCRYIGDQPG